jgi:hypothetical protein
MCFLGNFFISQHTTIQLAEVGVEEADSEIAGNLGVSCEFKDKSSLQRERADGSI